MKKYWKFILLGLIGISIWLIAPRIIGVEASAKAIRNTYWPILLLALLSELLSYAGIAALSKRILGSLEVPIRYKVALKLGFLNAFAVHVFPVGALGASSLDYYFLKRFGIKSNKIILLVIVRTIIIYICLFSLLLISLSVTRVGSRLSFNQQFLLYGTLIFCLIFLIYLIYLFKNAPLYFKRVNTLSSLVKKILGRIQGDDFQSQGLDTLGQGLYDSAQLFIASKKNIVFSIIFGFIYWLGDLFCLYFVLLSLGFHANVPVLIFGYTVGFVFSAISFIPGGVGVIEAVLTLLYISFGMPAAVTTIGVLIYRLISFWLIIPIGGLSFVSLSKNKLPALEDQLD